MADTYTQFLNLTKPEVGGSRDSWGPKLADNFDKMDVWAKATDALAKAAMPKAGGAFTGDITSTGAIAIDKELTTNRGMFFLGKGMGNGADIWRVMSWTDGALYFQRNSPGFDVNPLIIKPDGSLILAGNYDVKAQITAAATAGAAALAKAVRNDSAGRQDIPGTLAVTNYFDIVRGGVLRARLIVDGAGNTILRNGDNDDNFFYVSTSGAVWTKQFGDLNSRIEQRASDYANTVANSRVHSARFVYAGDLNMNWSPGGMNSPYGGYACVVDRWSYDPWGNGLYIDYAKRFRYLQIVTNNAGWFTVGAAS